MSILEAKKPIKNEISVCAKPGDRHAFRFLRNVRVHERPLTDPGPAAPDLVLFQAGQNLRFVKDFKHLPPQLWASAQQGSGKVVFDGSGEGKAHDPAQTDLLHQALARVGVPVEQGVYVTQNRQYAADYAAHRQAAGLSPGMRIVVYDYWIRRALSHYERRGPLALQRRLENFNIRQPQRLRRFISLNFTARPTKLIFLTRLMREDLWDLGYVSFGGIEQMKLIKNWKYKRIRSDFLKHPGFEAQAASLEPWLGQLAERGRMLLGGAQEERSADTIVRPDHMPEYQQSWFSVVTETEMLDRPARITEKALKPLLNGHPFIVFGNPGSLALIKALGFATFPELVDESYDEEPDPPRRFELAFAQLRRLCGLDEAELARMVTELEEKLVFNMTWGLTRLPQIYADTLDDAFLASVLEP